MSKIGMIFAFLILGIALLSNPVCAAEKTLITKGKFVDLLIRVMALEGELPPEAAKLSPDDLYRTMVAILANRGILQFVGTDRNERLRRGELADFLYNAVVKVPEALTVVDKIAFLADRGLIKKGKPTEAMMEEEVMNTLRMPELVLAIVETYIRPPIPEVTRGELPEVKELYEDPASPITP